MGKVAAIDLDIAKQAFQVYGVKGGGAIVSRRRLRRDDVVGFFKALPPCLIGIEVCATGHRWAWVLMAFGHEVQLMPASYVKRPTMRFVPMKTEEQQSVLMLHRVSSFTTL